jgi:hypothetical protein
MRMQFLLVMLLLLPTRAHAGTRDFSVTDVTQIVGEWEGSYFVKPSGTTGTSTIAVKKDGTWKSSATKSYGTFTLKDGKVRFQVLSGTPRGWIPAGRWTFFEKEGKLSFKTERDDLNVTGEYTKK